MEQAAPAVALAARELAQATLALSGPAAAPNGPDRRRWPTRLSPPGPAMAPRQLRGSRRTSCSSCSRFAGRADGGSSRSAGTGQARRYPGRLRTSRSFGKRGRTPTADADARTAALALRIEWNNSDALGWGVSFTPYLDRAEQPSFGHGRQAERQILIVGPIETDPVRRDDEEALLHGDLDHVS